MSVTKKILSDQVLYRLSGGVPDGNSTVDERDVWKAIEQKVNALFKLSQFAVNLPSGETIPDNLMLATYENISVVKANEGQTKSTLPVMPISLPRNAGINEIIPVLTVTSNTRLVGSPFIPMLAGQNYLLQSDTLLNDLMGNVGYTPNGRTIVYTRDLLLMGITKVDMKLVIFDLSQYGINDILPIPADMEDKIITDLYNQFAGVTPEQGIVNNFTNANQKANP